MPDSNRKIIARCFEEIVSYHPIIDGLNTALGYRLTPKDIKVLEMSGRGYDFREIANEFNIYESAVRMSFIRISRNLGNGSTPDQVYSKMEPYLPIIKDFQSHGITPSEALVMEMVYRGLSDRNISDEIKISETTVRHHRTSIVKKLQKHFTSSQETTI